MKTHRRCVSKVQDRDAIIFDAKSVRISYKDSEELNYDKESGVIHKTYNNWVRNLEKSIRANLGAF